nr:MAG TPA: hypothetical protein [Caudoviricetes sp.]
MTGQAIAHPVYRYAIFSCTGSLGSSHLPEIAVTSFSIMLRFNQWIIQGPVTLLSVRLIRLPLRKALCQASTHAGS